MYKFTLKIKGEDREFKRDNFFLRQAILANKHQIVADEFYQKEHPTAEEFEDLQTDLAKTISEIFDGQFTPDEFIDGLTIENQHVADDVLILALGGKLEKEEKQDDEKKA